MNNPLINLNGINLFLKSELLICVVHVPNLPCRVELSFLAVSLNLLYMPEEITAFEFGMCHVLALTTFVLKW